MSDETALAPIPRVTHASIAAAVESIEKAVGGRDALLQALALAPPSSELEQAIQFLGHPAYDATKLSDLCRAAGITLGQLLEALKQGKYARMWVAVTDSVTTHTPAVVDDLMTRAQVHTVVCPTCRGDGDLPARDTQGKVLPDKPREPCDQCRASGSVTVLPDLERQKVALEISGVLTKKPQVAIDNRQVHLPGATASPDTFAKLLTALDAATKRPTPRPTADPDLPADPDPPIEAESIEEAPSGT